MITLDEYKEHLVSVYFWPMDSDEKYVEERRVTLQKRYSDEYLTQIINDTYDFLREALDSETMNSSYRYYRSEESSEDLETHISLGLHGGYGSDILYIDPKGRVISRYVVRQVSDNQVHIDMGGYDVEVYHGDDIGSMEGIFFIELHVPKDVDLDEIRKKLLVDGKNPLVKDKKPE